MKNNDLYPYKKAVLKDRLGDLSKRWYIEYSAFDVQANKLLKKYEYEVNKFETDKERRLFAAMRCQQLNDLLAKGYHFDSSKEEVPGKFPKVADAYQKALDIKSIELSLATINSYNSSLSRFREWIENSKYSRLNINQLDEKHCYEFIDTLAVAGLNPRTINSGYIDYLKAFHNTYMKRNKEVKKNPWIGITKKKEVGTTRNIAFNRMEVEQLKSLISTVDSELWVFIQFMYYLFMRPNEIRQLQVYNIQISRGLVFIDALKAKNKKDAYVTIPPVFLPTLKEVIKGKRSMEFIFTGNQAGKPISKNIMYERHKIYLERLDIRSGHSLYPWKHTGVIMAYTAGVDIKSLQRQLRHHSLEETDTYLRNLGLVQNTDILNKFPQI